VLLSVLIIIPLSYLKAKNTNKINTLPSKSSLKVAILVNLLSLAGLPPFLGFLPKITVIRSLIFYSLTNFFTSLVLIVSSIVTLYFYLRIAYSSIIIFNQTPAIEIKTQKFPNPLKKLTILSLAGNTLICPLVLIF
jgi:NADH:ubiquinone oxidoreductase subunit 2 (subunit N)